MRRRFDLRVEGIENLPPSGAFLLCPNHESYLDPVAIAAALPRDRFAHVWWAGWTGFLFTSRLRRLFSRAAQIMPVDQNRGAAASLDMGTALLARGDTLVWFPEGGLTRDGKLQPFQAGIGLLIMRHPVPVVPVAISGSYEAWPHGGKFPPKRHPIGVRFGTPIDPARLLTGGAEADQPQRVADQLHDEVAALLQASRGDHVAAQ
jgi:long-chain acyl-CoA synthetase